MENQLDLNFGQASLAVVDGNAVIHRAFHALPPLTNKQNQPVGAVYGFFRVLFKIIREYQPTHLAVAFDSPGPTFRHQAFPEYKATRIKAPKELYQQIPVIKKILKSMQVPVLEKEGLEADDLIGSLVKGVDSQVGKLIVSGDSDLLQLVDKNTKVALLRQGVSQYQVLGLSEVKDKYQGLAPEQLIELKGLKGDSSDNIPGVPGVGDKTGRGLIKRFGSLEDIYRHLEEIPLGLRKKLTENKEQAFLSRDLGRIKNDAPVPLELEKYRIKSYNKKEAIKLLDQMGLKVLARDLSRT
ncbi:MAG TPA: 5'-3' exonuclease H3TH domain-containing protein [Candidatus Pacearchaeota archaeon]|nr:5'-3' exonuclease H3TH domain-containing protein [Candidatus Pacearchaeota archaeon]